VVSVIPYFGGTVDIANVEYRERLFAQSWAIIMDRPLFGDQEALLKMEALRQGEGIIDLVNGFMTILLGNGFAGLSLFLLFMVVGAFKTFRVSAAAARNDPDFSKLGACLVASMLGSMLMTWVGGLVDLMLCVLVGLMAAYVDVGRRLPSRFPGAGSSSQAKALSNH
jgi:O-antigen ligase